MSGKRRHNEREARLEAILRQAKLNALVRGHGVIQSALAPHGSYDQPEFVNRGYYVDEPFVCQGCGVSQIWTAAQQKWWYEVAKGSVFSTARLCRACRHRERTRKEARLSTGDPNPYKNIGLMLAKIRSDIEPKLLLAGYQLVGRSRRNARRAQFIDYSRSGDLFTLSWDKHTARLAAEVLTDGEDGLQVIAAAELSGIRSTPEIEDRLAPVMAAVRSFLDGLRAALAEPGEPSEA